tara:strand:+ start:1696 stop:2199 length:504 start_codon:yes stop_codon:yes gene_type:complete
MRKSAIATTAILALAVVAFLLDMTKQGYWAFTDVNDIKKALPNFVTPEFAKTVEANIKGCLTQGTQTKKITNQQIRTLRQLTNPDEIAALLGNAYCETDKGGTWVTESGRNLTLKFDKTLDYEFSSDTQSLTQKRTSKETNGSVDRPLRGRVSAPSLVKGREPIKSK